MLSLCYLLCHSRGCVWGLFAYVPHRYARTHQRIASFVKNASKQRSTWKYLQPAQRQVSYETGESLRGLQGFGLREKLFGAGGVALLRRNAAQRLQRYRAAQPITEGLGQIEAFLQ